MFENDSIPTQSNWKSLVKKYQNSSNRKSIWQLIDSYVPFFVIWYLMYFMLDVSYWITLLLSIPAAGFTVRIFIIQHDCGHGSFFHSKTANTVWGIIASVFTLTPYHYWRKGHSIHHANAGKLEHRGIGDIYTLTVDEYLNKSKWGRFKYRVYRNPFFLFVVIPTLLFVVLYRFPVSSSKSLKREELSIYFTTLLIALVFALVIWFIGFQSFLVIQLPITILASTTGTWLFYVQHQFPDTYWEQNGNWDYTLVALQGSSFYKLPKILQWFTGNIGYHHIHHLSPRIPNYNLEVCHKQNPLFQKANTLTLTTSFRSVLLSLWDENQKKLVGFKHLKNPHYKSA
ncbi:MAG: fatty acid desaturase [Bacteroidetes bacterium]|nr:fatty acid desaturase [Bacteroidota bacterium]